MNNWLIIKKNIENSVIYNKIADMTYVCWKISKLRILKILLQAKNKLHKSIKLSSIHMIIKTKSKLLNTTNSSAQL